MKQERLDQLTDKGHFNVSQDTLDKFNNIHAMSTKHYGPMWYSLFLSIAGQYPVTVDRSNPDHLLIVDAFKSMLTGLQFTLPCQFCRSSFTQFLIELPIDNFIGSRVDLMMWLYLMKDKVNTKLVQQEEEFIQKLLQRLGRGEITRLEYKKQRDICFKTKPTPPFEQVLQYYSQFSATCSPDVKKCVSNNYSLKF
jgi:Erv1 / Alr family